jgi:hypothetical protein
MIYLLRHNRNHKERWINSIFGSKNELYDVLRYDMNNPFIFKKLNDFFDYLPFAAIINDLVLCLYCGNESNFFL